MAATMPSVGIRFGVDHSGQVTETEGLLEALTFAGLCVGVP